MSVGRGGACYGAAYRSDGVELGEVEVSGEVIEESSGLSFQAVAADVGAVDP
jgi:hypothetical protein